MILIAGPPGAGKSIQAKLLEEEFGVKWLSMGKLLRASVDEQVIATMKQGKLLDDDLVDGVLAEAINAIPLDQHILLDGFPRRNSQVQWFIDYIQSVKRDMKHVLHIHISLNVALERLAQRGRIDDDQSVVKERYKQYEEEIVPMLQHLQHIGVMVHDIDGDQSIEAVHDDIVRQLKDFLSE